MKTLSKRLMAIGLGIHGALLAGCGGTECEELCEEARDCESANTELAGEDCAAECEKAEDLADEAGCDGAFEDFMDCAAEGDVCNVGDECMSDAFAYAFCVLDYCEENPNEEGCKGAVCSTGTSGGGTTCTVSRSCQGEPERMLVCTEGECTCSENEATVKTVPHDPSFCDGEHDAKVSAATSACGWD